jgi:PhnB protein
MDTEDGKIMHATVQIGDSQIMFTDAMQGMPEKPTTLYLYVEDVDRGV